MRQILSGVRKKSILLGGIALLTMFFLGMLVGSEKANAATSCCVVAQGDCAEPTASGTCLSGTLMTGACAETPFCKKPAGSVVPPESGKDCEKALGGLCVPPGSCNATINTNAVGCNGGVCCIPTKDCSSVGGRCAEGCDVRLGETAIFSTKECVGTKNDICCQPESVPSGAAGCCVLGKQCEKAGAGGSCPNGGGYDKNPCNAIIACINGGTDFNGRPFVTGAAVNSGNIDFTNPLGATSVQELLVSLLASLRSIVGVLAVMFIVIGGILYITSAGNDKRIELAKNCISGAVIGLAITVAAPALLQQVATLMGGGQMFGGALTLTQIALNVLNFLLSIFGVLAIVMLIIGGGMYLTSGGVESQIELGKDIFKYSLIGILVALSAVVIVRQISALIVG